MRKLSVSALVSLDGVIQDPGGFGEAGYGGWANPYFTGYAQAESMRHLRASDYFLIGRRTYELLHMAWGGIKHGAYLQRMNEILKLAASTTLSGPLKWNTTVIEGDVATAIAELKQQPGGGIEVYGSATLVQTLMEHNLIDEYGSRCTRSCSSTARSCSRSPMLPRPSSSRGPALSTRACPT